VDEAATATVFTIMSHGARSVPLDLSIDALIALFIQEGLSRVLVVDSAGGAAGVVSRSDLVLRQYLNGDTVESENPRAPLRGGIAAPLGAGYQIVSGETISSLMSPQVVSVTDEMTIVEACRVMSRTHLHGLPVISARHGPIGWLSATDVVRWVAARGL
jgi:CBS domain-containing protein